MEGAFHLDPPGLARSATLDVLHNNVDAFDHYPVLAYQVQPDRALLSLIASADDDDLIASPDLSHPRARFLCPLLPWS
jgi:hypothetical protein